MARNLYAEVSARILSQMEAGIVPWIKLWRATAGRNQPQNAVSRRPYSGCNVVLLWQNAGRFAVPSYLTFKQALELGGNVRKGEHGSKVYFVKRLTGKPKGDDDNTDDSRGYTVLREYTVFNVEQCEGLPDKLTTYEPPKPRHTDSRDPVIQDFITATKCDFREGGDVAFYSPAGDFVNVPKFRAFNSSDTYYSTAFHELGHWTGAKPRLSREFGKRFGNLAYAAEELVAELTSAFLCAEFDLNGKLQHADYLGSWIKLLKHDPRAFFTAASKAQAAADYMRGLALADHSSIAA